jgi:hypothetical protein
MASPATPTKQSTRLRIALFYLFQVIWTITAFIILFDSRQFYAAEELRDLRGISQMMMLLSISLIAIERHTRREGDVSLHSRRVYWFYAVSTSMIIIGCTINILLLLIFKR